MSRFIRILNTIGFYSVIFLLLAMFKTTENDIGLIVLITLIFTTIYQKERLMNITLITINKNKFKTEDKYGNFKPDKRTRVKGRKV